MAGCRRLKGMAATAALGKLHEVGCLEVNFFQPSFMLKSKPHQGAKISRKYYPPSIPYERIRRRFVASLMRPCAFHWSF